ncbi:hypothetical protein KDL01_35175, partial [Actinospica durhamensis]
MRRFAIGIRIPSRKPGGLTLGLLSALLAVGGSGAVAYALITAPTPPPQPTAAQAGTLAPAGSARPRTSASP